jgi:hypothetical protein
MKTVMTAILAAAAMMTAAPALAQPGDYRQGGGYDYDALRLQGERVDVAKAQLASAGYNKARNINYGGKQYDLWSNGRSRNSCVGFTSYNGRVTDMRAFDDAECGVVSGGWGQGGFDASKLQGLRVDDAKRNLQKFGYSNTRNVRIDGRQWDLWQNSRGRGCIGFTSYNVKVTGTRDFRGSECDGDWNSGGGWGGGNFRIDSLRGLSVDSAKRELSNAGFDKARNIRINGQQWDLWYDDNGRNGRCVGFTSYNGRVSDADSFAERDCY